MPTLNVKFALAAAAASDAGKVTVLNLAEKGVNAIDPALATMCPGLSKLDLGDNVLGDAAALKAGAHTRSLQSSTQDLRDTSLNLSTFGQLHGLRWFIWGTK
jgi:hypothetical protein